MELLQKLVRANALLLQGAYQGAENLLDSAIVDVRTLLEENARLRTEIDEANAQEPALRLNTMGGAMQWNPNYKGDWSGEFYARPIPAQQSPALALPDEETNFCALKSITDSQVNAVARAFWRRIYAYRNDYGIELPKPLPVEFMAHMATALTWVDKEPSPRITEQDAREIAKSVANVIRLKESIVDAWFDGEGRDLLAKLNIKNNIPN